MAIRLSTWCVFIRDIVRKKAVMALHSFYMKNPSAIPDVVNHVTKAIRDKDAGVMTAALHIFFELIKVKRTAGNIDYSNFI